MKVKEESKNVGLKYNLQKTKIMGPDVSHHFMANRWGNTGNSGRLYFGGLQNHCRYGLQPWHEKMLAPWKKWDGWMVSLTRWTWVWASSGSWWWTGKPGVLQSMGSQRIKHDLATELNLDSILKSRDITLSTKACIIKAMVFPVVIYGCESWAIKKAEHWRIDAFEMWC